MLNIKFNYFIDKKGIEMLLTSIFTLTKSTILSEKLKYKVIINKGSLYMYNSKYITYEKVNLKDNQLTTDDYLQYLTASLVESSFRKLALEEQSELREIHNKTLPKLFKSSFYIGL